MTHVTAGDILATKGNDVAWIISEATVTEALTVLSDRGVGALVVSANGESVDGIVSERDVVRALARTGPSILHEPVRSVMTTDVQTCGLDEKVSHLMAQMTTGRFRHLPVVEDDRLVGVVSIGDVVKQRLGELETEARDLLEFIQAR